MTVIGITGCTGAGKTTALEALRGMGAQVIDCDALYHEMLRTDAALLSEIRTMFPETFSADGTLDRKALGRIVFADREKLDALNSVTHRCVREEVQRRIQSCREELLVIDAVALMESGLGDLCTFTVAVTAPEGIRAARIMVREHITREYAMLRIRAQKPAEAFEKECTYTLENSYPTKEAFAAHARLFFQQILTEETRMDDKERLFYNQKPAFDRISEAEKKESDRYCEAYEAFLNTAKTEREAVRAAVALAKKSGFTEFRPGVQLKAGDKIYYNNRGKSLMLAVIGKMQMYEGANIAAAHIDSPRLDLKQIPLYEDGEIAYFKTHYYGGIKKYQWVTIPMELHGVVALKSGKNVEVCIGADDGDPVLVITDLLPHLAGEQVKKTMSEGITGESLNLVVGSEPDKGTDKDRVKLTVMKLLNEKYGITEEDFLSAELEAVPGLKARDVGLDRSLIGAYGHDDRVCAFAELQAILDTSDPEKTSVCILADKEEIGSEGISGMQSRAFEWFVGKLCEMQSAKLSDCFKNSFCLSADVAVAFDPSYPDVTEKRNTAKVNYGVALSKFTGVRGKAGSNDASAEVVAKVRRMFDENGVVWQMGELGKVDAGGGGTVAMYMADRNIDTIDAGVPVLNMHAPYELVAKLDCYMTYRGMKALYKTR